MDRGIAAAIEKGSSQLNSQYHSETGVSLCDETSTWIVSGAILVETGMRSLLFISFVFGHLLVALAFTVSRFV
jgi:hypothetical protein